MAQAKVITEQELKRALGIVAGRKHAARDRLALLLTHWAGMRVCEVAALTRGTVLGPSGDILEEWRLDRDQTKGSMGRVVYANSKLRKELAAYLKANPAPDRSYPVLVSQKGNGKRRGFSANTLCQHFFYIYKRAGITGASSHSGRRTFITTLASKGIGVRVLMHLAGHRSISTTQAYIDVNDAMMRTAVDLV